MRQPTEESFLKDVAKHEMTVLLDNGVYRHLRLKQPGSSNMWFDVVTYPGHLAYSGDMGSFVFSRLEDMFQFFRTDSKKEELGINLGYWGEKLQAVDRDGRKSSHRRYSEDLMSQNIEEVVKSWIEDYELSEEDASDLRYAIECDVCLEDGEHEAYRTLSEFLHKIGDNKFQFSDVLEWDCEDYTFRFVWCCYALAWSIRNYDNSKQKASEAA